MIAWTWISAAYKGTSHEKTGVRLQDALTCFSSENKNRIVFFAVISDGAGSASHGGEGASLVCRKLSQAARKYFKKYSTLPNDETIETWVDAARDSIFLAAIRRSLTPRDFAATLVCVISYGSETVIIHIGDGCVVLRDVALEEWIAPSWPDHGEYASTTTFITDEFLKLRITRHGNPISVIALFSDGIERLALNFTESKPFAGFFDGIVKPLKQTQDLGRNNSLSASLRNYLNSEAINARTDDDKSLIIAIAQ